MEKRYYVFDPDMEELRRNVCKLIDDTIVEDHFASCLKKQNLSDIERCRLVEYLNWLITKLEPQGKKMPKLGFGNQI